MSAAAIKAIVVLLVILPSQIRRDRASMVGCAPGSRHNRIGCLHIQPPYRSGDVCPFLYPWILVRAKDSVVGYLPAESIVARVKTNSVAYTRIILADREKAIRETCRLSRLPITRGRSVRGRSVKCASGLNV